MRCTAGRDPTAGTDEEDAALQQATSPLAAV
jgi:hypothetical protein